MICSQNIQAKSIIMNYYNNSSNCSNNNNNGSFVNATVPTQLDASIPEDYNDIDFFLEEHDFGENGEEELEENIVDLYDTELDIKKNVAPDPEVNRFLLHASRHLNEQLHSWVCLLAAQDNSDTKKRTFDRNVGAAVAYNTAMRTLLLKKYYNDNLFSFLPNNTWPQSFKDYVKNIQDKAPSESYIKKNKVLNGVDIKQQKLYLFGESILTMSANIKLHIKNRYNPLYLPGGKLKSGENSTGMFIAMIEKLHPADVHRRATANAKKLRLRQKISDEEFDQKIRLQMEKEKIPPLDWFPVGWIAFVLCGAPAGDDGITGLNFSVKCTETGGIDNKEIRGKKRKNNEIDENGVEIVKNREKKNKQDLNVVEHNVTLHRSEMTALQKLENLLKIKEKYLKNLVEYGDPKNIKGLILEEIDSINNEIQIILMKELMEEYGINISNTSSIRISNSSDGTSAIMTGQEINNYKKT